MRQTEPSTKGLGAKLRDQREGRGRSVRQLAERSGVARSTISRWERGESRPRRSQLDNLLDSLKLCEDDRKILMRSASAPQDTTARRRLLRAIRFRNGLSLSAAAERIGVSKAALSRWETGERWPGDEQAAHAAGLLGATASERDAVGRNAPLLSQWESSPNDLPARICSLREMIAERPQELSDMAFIGLRESLSHGDSRRDKGLRLELMASYMEWLGWWYRDQEAAAIADKMLPALKEDPNSPVWGRVLRARAMHIGETRNDPYQAIDLLADALPLLKGAPSEGFVYRELCGLHTMVGEFDESRRLLRFARDAGFGENTQEVHLHCCSMVESSLWSATGDYDRAVETLPATRIGDAYLQTVTAIGCANALRQAGERERARAEIEGALDIVSSRGFEHFARGLRRRLSEEPSHN